MDIGISKQEKDIEMDGDNFAEIINLTSIEEIPAEFEGTTVDKLTSAINETGLFIMGEIHGVKENVDVIYTLFKKFGFRQLALEWEPELVVVAEKFIETGNLDFNSIQDSPDGRVTAGHFALLKKLKDEGLLDKLICFDSPGATSWDERDANMAQNITEHLADSPTLVVAGDLHAEVEPITLKGDTEEHHPMGSLVKAQIPRVPSGKIEYLSGSYYNIEPQKFLENPEQEKTGPKFYFNENGLYTFVVPEANTATVPNQNEKL